MNKHTGSSLDDFLEEEGVLEEVSAKSHKRLLALQLANTMEESSITRTSLIDLPDKSLHRIKSESMSNCKGD